MFPNRKPIAFTILLGSLLGLGVYLFSNPNAKLVLESQGIYFYSWEGFNKKASLPAEAIVNIEDSLILNQDSAKKDRHRIPPVNVILSQRPNALKRPENIDLSDSALLAYDSLSAGLKYLYFSPKSDLLESFFVRLNNAAKQSVRIWYYGDSQVEGDRITREVRKEMQSRFGGRGIGFIPITNPATYMDLELGKQPDWKKYNCFQHRKKTSDFGPSGLVFLPADENSKKWNTIQLKVLKSLKYQQLSLQCNADTLFQVEWKTKKDSAWIPVKRVLSQKKINAYSIGDSALYGNIQIRCRGRKMKIYGLNFDGNTTGVYVDNFGIRGHSGDGLKAISNEILQSVSVAQRTGLVIFHYGNNMVPYLKLDLKSEKWVKDIFRSLFRKYRNSCPNMSFLVIGPGDMGYQNGEAAVCYPSCASLNKWMQEVAMEEGMAYFDFYQMIRDNGGILKWRESHIASLDGHLGPTGQRLFAKELTKELLDAFTAFKIRTGE